MTDLVVGQRVAGAYFLAENKWYLGYVTKLAARITVKLDDGDEVTLSKNTVLPVWNWANKSKPVPKAELKLYEGPVADWWKDKTHTPFGEKALMGMWLYINVHGLNSILDEPILDIGNTKTKKKFGSGQSGHNAGVTWFKTPKTHIRLHPKFNLTPQEMFETLAHEVGHQAQWEVDIKRNPRSMLLGSDMHGKSFLKWAGVLQRTVGVNITKRKEADDTIVLQPKEKKTDEPYFVVLVKEGDKYWGGYIDEERAALAVMMRYSNYDDSAYYGLTDAGPREFLQKVGYGGEGPSARHKLPPMKRPVVELVMRKGKSGRGSGDFEL